MRNAEGRMQNKRQATALTVGRFGERTGVVVVNSAF
jgi:hypothetical protein